MGSKILTLFDIEFKRIQKTFFTVIGLLGFFNIMLLSYHLYVNVRLIERDYNVSLGIKVLKTDVGRDVILNQHVPSFIYMFTCALLGFALIWCLFYSFRIWNRDFSEKTKSIYTLFMLPENKFIIFLSKLLTMVVLAYGIILVQHILWVVDGMVISKLTGLSIKEIIASINMSDGSFAMIGLPTIYPIEFFIKYLLGPIVVYVVVFTGVLMSKIERKGASLCGVVYVISIGMIYTSQVTLNVFYSDRYLIATLLSYLFISLLSLLFSYNLLNKQIYA